MKKPFIVFIFFVYSSNAAITNRSILLYLKIHGPLIGSLLPDAPAKSYGVYYFRKKISLTEKPDSFIVHVSADNRYVLIINEKFVSLGPARNDLSHWNFETVDIAPYLDQWR